MIDSNNSNISPKTKRAGDSHVLRRIASFFDDEDAALRVLKRYYRSGCIVTPEGKVSMDDFYRLQRGAWIRRNQSSVSHSVSILEKCFSNENSYRGALFGGTRSPRTLDDIENHRDFDGQYDGRYGKYDHD